MKERYIIWAPILLLCGLLPLHTQAGRHMPKLSDKKLCADAECSHPILIAKAIQDYYPQDCRFIPIHQGQLVYVYSMLKDRGNLFWSGSSMQGVAYGGSTGAKFVLDPLGKITTYMYAYQVQGSYYGEQEARLGHFPSSVVEETHALMPAEVEVKTNKWDFYC